MSKFTQKGKDGFESLDPRRLPNRTLSSVSDYRKVRRIEWSSLCKHKSLFLVGRGLGCGVPIYYSDSQFIAISESEFAIWNNDRLNLGTNFKFGIFYSKFGSCQIDIFLRDREWRPGIVQPVCWFMQFYFCCHIFPSHCETFWLKLQKIGPKSIFMQCLLRKYLSDFPFSVCFYERDRRKLQAIFLPDICLY